MYLLAKELENYNPTCVDKIKYDSNKNLGKVVIENVFGFLKNGWKFLKHLNFIVNKIIVACCVFHNYCEIWGVLEPRLANAKIRSDNLMGFGVDRLFIVREGKQTKAKGERLWRIVFE